MANIARRWTNRVLKPAVVIVKRDGQDALRVCLTNNVLVQVGNNLAGLWEVLAPQSQSWLPCRRGFLCRA